MLTKRAFLSGAAALASFPAAPAVAATDVAGRLRLTRTGASLNPSGPSTPAVITVDGYDVEAGLRLPPAREAAVGVDNGLAEPIALSWRGLRGMGDLDRMPAGVPAGASGTLPITPRDAGTALLRAAPSPLHFAEQGAQVAVVVPEPTPPQVDHDIVLHLSDWLLAGDNSLRFGSVPPVDAVLGVVSVNGDMRPRAMTAAPRARLRLRFVNGSAQRLMLVSCTGAHPMIAAIDGQPSELFAPNRNTVPIGPGARYDLLLDMPDAPEAQVRFTLKPTLAIAGKLEPERDLLVLRSAGPPLPAKPPATALPANPALPVEIPLEKARRADLVFDGQPGMPNGSPRGWSVNGASGSLVGRPVLEVRQGDAVVLGLVNASKTLVPLRVGGHSVRLLHAKDDGWEPYWRDTLLLPPGSRNHVAFVADTPGRWPIDSGFDDLTLAGLSCFFTVRPG